MDRPQLLELILAKYDRYVQRVVRKIKRLPKNCMQSGDDSPMRNVWEEWVVQVQGQQSIFFEFYESTIMGICREVVEALPKEEQGLLWLWSDGWYDWDEEEDGGEIPYGDQVVADLELQIYSRLVFHAGSIELPPRLQEYLY